ncbi:hypothetical protein BT93_E1840 [Corymbia citriodora subsp. variegata]|nr:hypothetical protein BT93_E1840 [Corymbia citriodora subsp. variegata]
MILQNSSGSFRFSSNMFVLREDEKMSRSALSTFRAKKEEIKRKKMEEETQLLATIREKNSSEDDGGEDKAAEEQEIGSGEADEARHRVAFQSGQDITARVGVHLVLSLRFAFGYCIGSWCGFLYWMEFMSVLREIGLEKKGYSQISIGFCTSNL